MSNTVNMHNCVTRSYSFSNVTMQNCKDETTENEQENTDKIKQYKSMCLKHVFFSYTIYRSISLLNSSQNTKKILKESHNCAHSFFNDYWIVFIL